MVGLRLLQTPIISRVTARYFRYGLKNAEKLKQRATGLRDGCDFILDIQNLFFNEITGLKRKSEHGITGLKGFSFGLGVWVIGTYILKVGVYESGRSVLKEDFQAALIETGAPIILMCVHTWWA